MHTCTLPVLALGAGLVLGQGMDLAGFQIAMEPTLMSAFGTTAAMYGNVVEMAGESQIPF